jgi:hypothetical protein
VTLDGRKLQYEELSELSAIRIINLRKMRCAGHKAGMGEKRNVFGGKNRRKESNRKTEA